MTEARWTEPVHVVLMIAAFLLLMGLVGGNDTDHDWWD
jgi:hypothetical protein